MIDCIWLDDTMIDEIDTLDGVDRVMKFFLFDSLAMAFNDRLSDAVSSPAISNSRDRDGGASGLRCRKPWIQWVMVFSCVSEHWILPCSTFTVP